MKYGYEVVDREVCHQGFFRLERLRLRHELFGGGWSGEVVRELLERGHAAAVILYDPALDSVVMVEQFRVGALDAPGGPWLLEFVAGIIEPGEVPEDVVRREAVEEAGCRVTTLEPVTEFSLSPGGCSERIHLFCGRVDASRAGGVHGLPEEGEDILVRVIPVDRVLEMLAEGRIDSAWSIIAVQWLALNRDRLRERWLTE